MSKNSQFSAAEAPEIVVHSRNSGVSSRFRDHVHDKLAHASRFAVRIARIDVEVSHETNPRQHDRAFEVELTCHGAGSFLRAEAHAADKYTALDLAYAHLESKLRKMHDKAHSIRHRKAAPDVNADLADIEIAALDVSEYEFEPDVILRNGPLVVRTKEVPAESMSVEQAVGAMERLGHEFFLFKNIENGLSSVIYRRRGYDYGLIQLA